MDKPNPRLHSPAADRNKGPILTELLRRLPAGGRALEIASGSGQHVLHFAAALPGWHWQPSDTEPAALASIAALSADAGLRNVATPRRLDLLAPTGSDDAAWPAQGVDLVLCANLLHIAPWPVCAALMRGSAQCLTPRGRLITYGPYRVDGEPLQQGNQAFDVDLRQRNPAWGLRWLHDVVAEAHVTGLVLRERVAMPADNLLLVFERADPNDPHSVRIEPAGVGFPAPASHTLLASALEAGVRLPSSCRNGSCRSCLSRLRSGAVRYEIAWPGLSAEEQVNGWILPCVAYPTSDVVLEAAVAR